MRWPTPWPRRNCCCICGHVCAPRRASLGSPRPAGWPRSSVGCNHDPHGAESNLECRAASTARRTTTRNKQRDAAMTVLGIPIDFVLFAITLLGVAVFHHHTLNVALTGAAAITLYQLLFAGFKTGTGLAGLAAHEWVTLANLLGLLLGFALLADHFERSRVTDKLPQFLPDDWKGGFVLLIGVFVMSGFLDNIAAAMIGGTMAAVLYKRRVHIGFL